MRVLALTHGLPTVMAMCTSPRLRAVSAASSDVLIIEWRVADARGSPLRRPLR